MSFVVVQNLIDRVRSASDQQNSAFISDQELIDWLNVGVQTIYDILTRQVADYSISILDFDTTVNQERFLLPEDFYKLRFVGIKVGEQRWIPISRFNMNEYGILGAAGSFGFPFAFRLNNVLYRIIGNYLYFEPIPSFPLGSFRMLYVPSIRKIKSVDDTIDDWAGGFEEYAVCHATIQAKMKEESDVQANLIQLKQLEERIIAMADDRDFSKPDRVADFRRQTLGFGNGNGYGTGYY